MWRGKHSRLLTQQQVERIHQRSIDALERIGINVDLDNISDVAREELAHFDLKEAHQVNVLGPEGLYKLVEPKELAISPDGFQVAEGRSLYNLWAVTTDGREQPVHLTRGLRNARCPMWSPGSKQISFLSDRGDEIEAYQLKHRNMLKEKTKQPKPQLWILDLNRGGEARQITYCPEGAQIAYAEPLK